MVLISFLKEATKKQSLFFDSLEVGKYTLGSPLASHPLNPFWENKGVAVRSSNFGFAFPLRKGKRAETLSILRTFVYFCG